MSESISNNLPYAVIRAGAQQFSVRSGDEILVQKVAGEKGSNIVLDQVVLLNTDGSPQIGAPLVKGASVTARIIGDVKSKKVIIFKKRRRTGYTKKQGHRQTLTRLKIESNTA